MKIFKKNRSSVSASTIIETIVSMTLLLTILTLFFTQVDKINGSVNPHVIYKAHNAVKSVLFQEDLLIEKYKEYNVDGLTVIKNIESHPNGLYFIEVSAIDNLQKEIYSRTKWISARIEF